MRLAPLLGFTLVLAIQATASLSPSLEDLKQSFRRPATACPEPKDNLSNPDRVELGKKLFFDPRLSGSGQVSCATCHNPSLSWGDGLARAVGTGGKSLERRTPTLLDLGWCQELFWDGRAATLEQQALMPILSREEMNQNPHGLIRRISGSYRPLFTQAYPEEPVDLTTIAKALACFERTIVSSTSAFDRWVDGQPEALSAAAQRGFVLFNHKARCVTCHSGWRMTDDGFYDIGARGRDTGRARLYPGVEAVDHAFKTPTLRDVARRYPYMHDGSEKTLMDVVELYNQGGRVRRPSLSDQIRPLNLSFQERADLVEFLKSLTGSETAVAVPVLPR